MRDETGLSDAPVETLGSTASLLRAVRSGDAEAREQLMRRFLLPLRRWAGGNLAQSDARRLPSRARELVDTDDLVQLSLIRTLNRVGELEPRRPGAFLVYVRQAVRNQIRDEVRRAARRPEREPLDEGIPLPGQSPLEAVMGKEDLADYEAALSRLPEQHREAVVMRIELGFTYEEVAEALGCPSANAARMRIVRAVLRLTELLKETRR